MVIDLHEEDGRGDLQAVAEIFRPLPGERIWFSWEDAPAPGEVVVGPHTEAGVATAQPEGRLWVQDTNGSTKTEETGLQPELRTRTLSPERGKYIWNQIDRPMVLMVLPPGRPLHSVDLMPMCDGVWERNHRLCLFWGAPPGQTSYAFSLGSPTGSLAPNTELPSDFAPTGARRSWHRAADQRRHRCPDRALWSDRSRCLGRNWRRSSQSLPHRPGTTRRPSAHQRWAQ